MEIVGTILSMALVLFAATGFIATIAILTALIMVKNGGLISLGYEEDNEIINDNNNEDEK